MANYLLLRDNKETGPYSLKDLLEIGFKAYDLVWIQGKSAAWRYPSEVEELKIYAPASEEQPFDRFYKKNTEQKIPDASSEKNESLAFKKAVFVTMPPLKKEVAETETEVSSQSGNTYQRIKTITVTENPVAAEVKFAQPLDEIKDMYVKTLQQRKQKIARKNKFIKNLKRASVFIYVLALGVLIGFVLRPKSSKSNIANQSVNSRQSSVPDQTALSNSSTELPVQQIGTIVNKEQQEPVKEISKQSKSISENPTNQRKESNTKNENIANSTAKKDIATDQNSPVADLNTVTGERIKKTRNSDVASLPASKDDISKLVSVKSSDYKRGVFGGIRDLQLTVTNDSKYILDNVVVALQYLKPSEEPLKTENISFQSISPNGSLTIAIPPSNRGIKVSFKIVKIESKQLNDQTAGL